MVRKLFLYVRADISVANYLTSGVLQSKVQLNTSVGLTRLTKCGYMDAGRCGGHNIASHVVGLLARRVIGFQTGGGQVGIEVSWVSDAMLRYQS